MHVEEYRNYCLAKAGVTEEFPFDENTLVFKVMGKMFTACDVDEFVSFNVKCDPELAIELRERYNCVQPGYHMNKKHWNTVLSTGEVNDDLRRQWIDHSYDLVVSGMPKKLREQLLG